MFRLGIDTFRAAASVFSVGRGRSAVQRPAIALSGWRRGRTTSEGITCVASMGASDLGQGQRVLLLQIATGADHRGQAGQAQAHQNQGLSPRHEAKQRRKGQAHVVAATYADLTRPVRTRS